MSLTIAPGVELPDEIVTETIAMLAKRGGGKSNAALVLAEGMWDAGFPWVAIDPKGDWWGVRSSADGKRPGLPVPVFGGLHGDIPLEPTAGTLMAQLVIDRGITCVLDVSQFSKAEQIRFVTDFAETLFNLIRRDPRALHLFLEEAEEFLPQRVDARAARMVGAYSKISKQGRAFGLGVTLITQRSASLNKDALSQTDTLVVFRTPSPHDRKAIAGWLEHHEEAKDVASSLSELEPGESWIVSPGFLGQIVRVKWNRRRTFDSGATPKAGAVRRTEPVSLADIDLNEVAGLMAETIEKAASTDPKALQKRVRDLERQLADQPTPDPIVEFIDIPLLDEKLVERFEKVVAHIQDLGSSLVESAGVMTENLGMARAVVRQHASPSPKAKPVAQPQAPRPQPDIDGVTMGKTERNILTVLAQFPQGRSHVQLAMLSGYSPKASTIGVALSKLRKLGYAEPGGNPIRATPKGIAALGPYEELPQGPDLLAYWRNRVGGTERNILDVLVGLYPQVTNQQDLAERTGYSPAASTIGVALSKLRKLEIVDGWKVSDDFMEAIA